MQIVIDISDDEVFKGYYTQKDGINEYHSMKSEYTVVQPKSETVTEFADRCRECGAKYGKAWQFAEWVAREIFDDMWEYNKDTFAEIACRKLAKLGIVKESDNVWELVEQAERK